VIDFHTRIVIERPIEEVFAYVADPGNLPSWNSAVRAVQPTSPVSGRVGSTYSMDRQLPIGRVTNRLEIVLREHPREFAIRTTNGPTPFLYRYRFAAERDRTILELDGRVELPAAAGLIPQLGRRALRHGVQDNLTTLKRILEDG